MYIDESLTLQQILTRQKELSDPATYPVYTHISDLKIQAWVGMKSISYQMVVRGDTGSYMSTIVFDGVEFKPAPDTKAQTPVTPPPAKPTTPTDKDQAGTPQGKQTPPVQVKQVPQVATKPDPEWKEIDVSGKKFLYHIPSLSQNTVRLRDSCSEFQFRWSLALDANKAIVGPWHKYQRVTPFPPKGLPVKNPGHMPGQRSKLVVGACKHLLSAIKYLHQLGLVRE